MLVTCHWKELSAQEIRDLRLFVSNKPLLFFFIGIRESLQGLSNIWLEIDVPKKVTWVTKMNQEMIFACLKEKRKYIGKIENTNI